MGRRVRSLGVRRDGWGWLGGGVVEVEVGPGARFGRDGSRASAASPWIAWRDSGSKTNTRRHCNTCLIRFELGV